MKIIGDLDDPNIIPEIRGAASREEAEAIWRSLTDKPDLLDAASYFSPRGFMDKSVREHRIIVDWYITALRLLGDVRHAQVGEDEAPMWVDFRGSYAGWCSAHGIAPEQDATWNALYTHLRLTKAQGFATLSAFMRMSGNSHAVVNGRD
jgi:hypothetical protein